MRAQGLLSEGMPTVPWLLRRPLENRLGSSDEGTVCFVQKTVSYYDVHLIMLITRPTGQHSRSGLLLFSLVLGTQPSGVGLEIGLVLDAV